MSKTIEKNIPIPERAEYDVDGLAKTMRAMNVGDSFLCEPKEYSSIFGTAKYVGIKVKTRRTPEGQYRIWRVKKNGAK